ncbi:MAG TPA: FlgD immunoglobulin-like domain containing protein, partial [bacterium]|nr:FlgD immunoglobulin-like domain containing protein [bacterium]
VAADREDGFSARPNPFHGADGVEISLALPRSAPVELGVYDIQGRLIRTLIRRTMDPGNHQVHWDGRRDTGQELPAGVYFLRLRGHGAVRGERIVKIR